MSKRPPRHIVVRNTQERDYPGIFELSRKLYPQGEPWLAHELSSHRDVFPEGQFVAIDDRTEQVVGMAASLIIRWDDYQISHDWYGFTADGLFTNHDPTGRTLYGAEIMVDPAMQGKGVGKLIYRHARFDLCRRLGLLRVRAGARLRGYHKHADEMTPEQYVRKVIDRELYDPTLTFQLKRGFRVIAVVHDYLDCDPASRGAAALIEWINHQVAQRRDYAQRDRRFGRHRRPPPPGTARG